jgi:S1-C subfamily serine protease
VEDTTQNPYRRPTPPTETPAPATPFERAGASPTALPEPPRGIGPDRLPPQPPVRFEKPIIVDKEPPEPDAPQPRRWALLLAALLAGILGAGLMVAILAGLGFINDSTEAEASPPVTIIERVTTELVPVDPGSTPSAEAVGRKVFPSIVTVEVGNGTTNGDVSVFGSGSGVVLSNDGLIVTNHHVIQGADASQVIFQDGSIYQAEVIGSDPLTDLAVLRIEAGNLTPIDLGSTEDLAVGQPAVAVGNPLGQEGGASLTVGVLSAFNRDVQFSDGSRLSGMLQTDAPITQGSSGGALVDINGSLIGITSAIGVSEAGAEGIGYATPVEIVERITAEIVETGAVRHAFLGIEGQDHLATQLDGALKPAGAEIATLLADSAAGDAGLEAGDIIVRMDDQEVRTMQDLVLSLRLYRVGNAVELEVERNGRIVAATVVLGERPDDP